MDFRVLCVGDVVGNPGMDRISRSLRYLKRKTNADFVIVNGENAAVAESDGKRINLSRLGGDDLKTILVMHRTDVGEMTGELSLLRAVIENTEDRAV